MLRNRKNEELMKIYSCGNVKLVNVQLEFMNIKSKFDMKLYIFE